VSYGEVLGDKSIMYIKVTVLSHFFPCSSGFILYYCIYECMFCMVLFSFVNYCYVIYSYYYVMRSFVNLSILVVMYVPFCVF
jgi:hypothetical protein